MEVNKNSENLILDFDHTLFLSNSTEEYLASARPKTACAFILVLLEWLKLWNLFPGKNKRYIYRDAIRVFIVSSILPWTYILYILRINHLAKKYLNPELLDLISSKNWEKIIIASNGFGFIIQPIIRKINTKFDLILNASIIPSKLAIRAVGKKKLIQKELDPVELNKTTFITDNQEDKILTDIVGEFKFYEWPTANNIRANQHVYIPFVYTHASKRGNKNHVLNVIISEDFPIIILAYALANPFSIQLFLSLFFLVLSFWCIYEVGYFENDLFELNNESVHKNPTKINYAKKLQNFPFEFFAWIWALGFGLIGVFLIQDGPYIHANYLLQLITNLSIWACWLVAVRIIYWIYNHSSFTVRQFFFSILQISRLAGPVLFFSTHLLGIFLIISQVVSRWVGYLVYRGGGDPNRVQRRIVRHTVFAMLAIGFAIAQQNPSILFTWQFITIFLWSVIRGHIKNLIKRQGNTVIEN